MSTLTFPAGLVPNHAEYGLRSQSQVFQSELSGTTQTVSLPIDLWTATLTFSNRQDAEAHALRAFLVSLRGRAGRFYLPMFDKPTPSGTAAGTGLVNGTGQTGNTLTTDGWTASQAGLLLPGDYFQVGNEVHMITATAAANSSGVSTLTFTPPLRSSPADNAPIITTNPCCVAMLQDDSQAKWPVQPGMIYALSIACIEAMDI